MRRIYRVRVGAGLYFDLTLERSEQVEQVGAIAQKLLERVVRDDNVLLESFQGLAGSVVYLEQDEHGAFALSIEGDALEENA